MDANLQLNLESIFDKEAIKVRIYQSKGITTNDNYDPFRKIGQIVSLQNPITIDALIRQVSPFSRSLQVLGITETDAVDLIIKKKDFSLFKIAQKVTIDNIDYYIFPDKVRNKMTFTKLTYDFYKVRIYRKQI
jgi:hypothetical protein